MPQQSSAEVSLLLPLSRLPQEIAVQLSEMVLLCAELQLPTQLSFTCLSPAAPSEQQEQGWAGFNHSFEQQI